MNLNNDFEMSFLGLFSNDSRFLKEIGEVKTYYEFYEGRPEGMTDATEIDLMTSGGQVWKVDKRDYKPTREVRNITKKLMKKQKRFMTSVAPSLVFHSLDGTDAEIVDNKRAIIENILNDGLFWNKFGKAFLDCTIGKRVLLTIQQDLHDTEAPLKFVFYTMPEFIYKYNPNNIDELINVQIAYQDEGTVGKIQQEQRWHKWVYEMVEDSCWCTYSIVDGCDVVAFIEMMDENTGVPKQVELMERWDTGLSVIPCKVILNDGLTGDIRGKSDIKDLMDMGMDYNKTVSDYRDALRFKMFEQPVFTNAAPESIQGMKIAPNSIVDLKGDPSLGNSEGDVPVPSFGMLSSTFNFQVAADSYLMQLKKDMYELMDQPLPESLVNVASGKALRMLNDDLIGRCEEKWQEWDEAVKWTVDLIIEMIEKFPIYRDKPNIQSINTNTSLEILHNYPIPDDEIDTKTLAIKEVEASVRSKQSYIREYGNAQEADKEFDEILGEMDRVNMTQNSASGLIE